MTVSSNDIKIENNTSQVSADVNAQVPLENNISQKQAENKAPEEDPNWRAFREARKKDRQEKESAERRLAEKEAEAAALKAAMEAAFSREEKSGHHRADSSDDETEDERIEKKVQAAIAAREQASERARQEREQHEYPQRLAQAYTDFNQTISSENLDYLEYHYPEVASPLKRLPEGYDKWADIYKAVKKFVPNASNAKKDAARADVNFNKPKSMSSTGVTQAGDSQGSARLTEERKQQNWERMQKMLKSVG